MATTFTQLVNFNEHNSAVSQTIDNVFGGSSPISLKDSNKNVEVKPKGSGIIDVVNDFDWIVNRSYYNYNKIPKVFITERAQQESTLISAYYYYITNILNSATFDSTGIKTAIDKFTSKYANVSDSVSSFFNSTASFTANESSISSDIGRLKHIFDHISSLTINDKELLGEYLKSYLGIYISKPTGFNYILPHFEDTKFANINNSWDQYSDDVFRGVEKIYDNIIPLVRPGVFVENPQYFKFSENSQSDTLTVKFPLLNTVSNTYKKNYELLWLLSFQNKYYRESFAAVRPPKIYTVQIPGQKFMPYAYIERMEVDFVGTRRILNVDTPAGSVDTPIPEAYNVTITFKSLITDSANIMLTDGFHKQISVSQVGSR